MARLRFVQQLVVAAVAVCVLGSGIAQAQQVLKTVTLVPANTVLSSPKTTGIVAWPAGLDAVKFQLLDSNFTQPGTTVVLDIEFSWDGGLTFPVANIDHNEWVQGAKARDGSAPSVQIGPFLGIGGVPNNPTHVRGTFKAGVGTPTCGLQMFVLNLP